MANFKDHFSTRSADYAAHRPTYPAALADFLAGISPGAGLALDCGCGSGQLSVLLARRFERVVATDASARQIENAEPHPRVDYRCAPAERSGLPEASVDAIAAAQAAHWFDLAAFYGEVRRVARPHAVLALITYGVMSVDETVDPVVMHFYREVVGPYWPAERRHVEDGYRSLPFPFREVQAPDLRIEASWTLGDFLGYVDTWSAVREAEKAHGRGLFEAFCAELAAAWGAAETRRMVRWPLSLRVGHVTAP